MMEEIAIYVTQFLTANVAINVVLGREVYWDLAEEEGTKMPFCNFSIEEAPGRSKDLRSDFYVTLSVYDNRLTKVARVGDVIREQIEVNTHWYFESGICEYVRDGKDKYAVRQLKYKIRK